MIYIKDRNKENKSPEGDVESRMVIQVMEKEELKGKIKAMRSRNDLLGLLNSLKFEEAGPDATPFTSAQLSYFCNPKNPKRFKVFAIPKKSGGKREISAPVEVLRSMLHYVNIILSSMYNPKQCVMGFTQGRNVADNARMHVRQNYVLNIDLSDFFPSVDQARVWKRLQVKPYNLSKDIASAIAGLCSIEIKNEDGCTKYVLPQGSPASPILTNMICERLDYKLTKLAHKFGVNYSRYADDMTFSSMHTVYGENKEFMASLRRIISEEHFEMNERKTRLQKKGGRQEVTGLNVASHANVTRRYVNWIRTILHIWEKYGYQEAYSYFYPKYKEESGHRHKGEPDLVNVLSGKLLYMRMVKGERDSTYVKLKERFDLLADSIGSTHPDDNGLKYILSYTLLAFEKKYSTVIEQKDDDDRVSFGFNIKNVWQNVMLSKDIERDQLVVFLRKLHSRAKGTRLNGNYYISLCSGHDSHINRVNYFWLITNEKPKIILGDTKIGVDALLEAFEDGGIDVAMALINAPKQLGKPVARKSSAANDKSHTPHAMVSALYKFSQHDIIKWYTHQPDSNCIDIKSLLDMNKKKLSDWLLTGNHNETINKRTWTNIKNFVLQEKEKGAGKGNGRPLNAFGDTIHTAWGDERVRDWCEKNANQHPYYAVFDGVPFSESIMAFKHAIEFRTDHDEMTFRMRVRDWITRLCDESELTVEYSERFVDLEPVQIFTDVRLVFASIKKIITWISDNKSKSGEVLVDVDNQSNYVELVISHIGSRLAMVGKKRDGLDGDFEEIRLMLLAVADLKIEADHSDGKSYSVVCLDKGHKAKDYNLSAATPAHMKTPCSWNELPDRVGGVKYFIRMYKNI